MAIENQNSLDLTAAADLDPPRAAYVHVPFCRHRCGYCNFSVLAGRDDLVDAYLSALQVELSQLGQPRVVDTLFIGGGTPTHFDGHALTRFLTLVRDWFPRSDQATEFSVEANPNDITPAKLDVLKAFGVDRISLGVQSFDADKLKTLERTHSPDEARTAIQLAAETIGNVSIDLIFATPEETPAAWRRDLRDAVALPLSHLSTYGLTFEKGTSFWNRLRKSDLAPIVEEDQLEMFRDAISIPAAAGLKHYEVSNHALPGRQCHHNMAYWRGVGWYAAGPGAASFVDGRRAVNHRSTTTYIKRLLQGKSPIAESEQLTNEQLIRERVAFGLRMLDGIDLRDVGPLEVVDRLLNAKFQMLIEIGMLKRTGSQVALTPQGLFVSDSVVSEIL
ncbi:Oxygen-independent coproporphyrinogen-III oxidase-like protein [Rosistilla carotiformis]|uniref:Heme chaperone HemW n=1 Tax=Rosistilla carotiformis TaxID=2528017 RepID=A0A518JT42_9BACT|nr:radical SAM family heme chaperone HemW [Rosistilla carotiformis]QDV68695.1 Oxygen-independent coproporphyrinogen-III oxidase-like protein [Rosistilla carotiformis]